MTMTFRLLLTAVVLATTPPVWAAPASDGYCADAVDFAMRTAERRVAGKTQASILQSIRESPQVFKQQYPDLEENVMREMVLQPLTKGWTLFVDASPTARTCATRLGTSVPPGGPPPGVPTTPAPDPAP